LKRLGIHGQRSHEKRIPAEAFQLDDAQLGLLLRHLWATDGCIHVRAQGRGAPRVYFSTCSEGLARDVAALLMRLGLVARLRVTVQGDSRPLHSVDISGSEQQALFLTRVGAFGPRVEPAERLREYLHRIDTSNPNVDTLPLEAFADVRAAMQAGGVTTRRMAQLRGTSYGGTSHFRFAPSRETVRSYADLLDSAAVRRWIETDLFWDRVADVVPAGEEPVYDLTVPGPSSWLADGIVSHNSGAIEQDADLILMIYREEVYEPNTPRKGIADIIITKQRNGPTGEVHLTFLGEFTRFENLVAESYGEGAFR
jgi:replicative DNA helicase